MSLGSQIRKLARYELDDVGEPGDVKLSSRGDVLNRPAPSVPRGSGLGGPHADKENLVARAFVVTHGQSVPERRTPYVRTDARISRLTSIARKASRAAV